MKHKRSSAGFVSHLLLIALAVIVLTSIGLIGLRVFVRHDKVNVPIISHPNYIAGELRVKFKDGTTSEQALSLINSYRLTVEEKPEAIDSIFTPRIIQHVQKINAPGIIEKLHQYPYVIDIKENKFETVENGYIISTTDEELTITFSQQTTSAQVRDIIYKAGMGGISFQMFKQLSVKVPIGQEKNYVNKFKQNILVEDTTQVSPLEPL